MGRTEAAAVSSPKVPLPPRHCQFVNGNALFHCHTAEDLIACDICDLVVCRTHSEYCECCETRRCADCHGEHLPDCDPFRNYSLDPYDDMFEDMERGKAGAA